MTSGTNRSSSNVLETPPVPHTRKSTSASKCGILGTPSGWTLDRLLIRDRPDTLEAAWREGLKLLAQLENALAASPTSDIAEELWERKIAKLREEPIQKPTIIGVMGSTGAGKSSVINAILDEDDIIPTSCMRACTAVVTEIMYNHDEIPYRAEIEYLTRSAWEAELTILLDELLDENGQVSNDYTDETSLAGAAYSKIRAVYPKMTRTEFEGRDVKMMADKVANLLEETNNPQKLSGTDPRIFRTALKEFVDSKDKRFGQSTLATTGDSLTDEERQLWPLIKVVRIYVKSRALSTGVILVDLPGLADANAGRAKVARDYYIEHAKSIWIVAPIIRAVDDGVAKTLLGDSMKRQLVMDGSLKSITFVCSKTDEIDFTKAQQRPEVAENLQPLRKEEARLNNTRGELTDGIKEYRKTKEIYQGKYEEADRELKEWKDRKECLEKGIKVPVPHMETTEQRPRKRRRHAEPEASAELQLLTPEQVRAEMTTLQIEKQSAGCEVATLVKLIEKHQGDRARVVKDLKRNQSAIRFACIQQRNAYSVQTMQNQFASGNETFDRDLAAEEGVEWHPRKDYDALKGELPVFCVSANGYQSLEGRRHKDAVVAGFANAEQTQIPELRRHCMSMTNEPRMAGYKRFLNSLSTLTYRLVASLPRDNNAFDMSKHWMITEESRLRKDMEKLALNVTSAVNVCGGKIHDALRERILERLGHASTKAVDKAVLTVEQWSQAVDKKGYPYSVYKAFCRRDGEYRSPEHNWNAALAAPFMKTIINRWEDVFVDRVPQESRSLRRILAGLLYDFHKAQVEQAASEHAAFIYTQPQIRVYINIVEDAVRAFEISISAKQKQINRQPVEELKKAMTPTYKACNSRRGADSFKRMKKVMWDSVEERKGNIFQDIVNKIHVGFEEMIDMNVKALIGKIVHDILPRMAKDYLYLLSGGTTLATSISRQRSTDEILKILHESKQVFKKILDDEKDLHPGDDGPDIVPGAYSEEKIEPDETIAVPAIEEPERSGHVSNDTSSTLSSALSSQSSNGSDTNIGARAD